ncbi:MAG: type VI secretion system protein TssA [Polyangiaceae bacterium]|nr:type VI secretion system protein TssA [Polyangiaceae bacterium]
MGLVNREQLLSPISEGEPSGADLGYDPAFAELESAVQGKPEQRMGDSVVAGKPPDWSVAFDLSVGLLQRTHDLRVAAYLATTLLHRNGFAGFGEGLALVKDMLAEFWPTVHPELDHEEGDDPIERINALASLCTPALFTSLRSTPLARTRALGAVTLQDTQAPAPASEESAEGGVQGVSAATIDAIFREVELAELEATTLAVQQAMSSLAGIDAVFEEHTGSRGPDLAQLVQVLREVSRVLTPRLAARQADASGTEAEVPGPDGDGQAAAARGGALSGEIRSREDVVRAIDKVCAYYARYEPTSPLPLLLERCKRLVTSSFLDIIRDLVPDSLTEVERLGGIKPE